MTIWKALGTVVTDHADIRVTHVAMAAIRARHQGAVEDINLVAEPGDPLDAVLRYTDPEGRLRSVHLSVDVRSPRCLRIEAVGDAVMFGTVADVTATLSALGPARCYTGNAFASAPGRHDAAFGSLDQFGFKLERLLADGYLDEASLAVIVDWQREGAFGQARLDDILDLDPDTAATLEEAIATCEEDRHLGALFDFLDGAYRQRARALSFP